MKDYTQYQGIDPLTKEVLKYRRSGSVLALGAGSNALWLADHSFAVTSVDESRVIAEEAGAAKLDIDFIQEPLDVFDPATIGRRFDVLLSICSLHLVSPLRLAWLVSQLKKHTTPGGFHFIKALGQQTPRSSEPHKTSLMPWLEWYNDWRIGRYEYRDDDEQSRFASSQHWLYDHTTILISQKPDEGQGH